MLRRSLWLFVFSIAHTAAAQNFIFDLRGAQEVPPVPSVASGGCMATLSGTTLSVTCVHDVAGATIMHIHRGAPGVNGPILFDLGDPASPVTATWTGMSPADVSDLVAGNLYINIHTAGRPAGEIRGQILPRTVDTVAFTADGGQYVPPNSTTATASCTADLDNAATFLAVSCTHNVPSPTAAHVHEAPVHVNGPIVFTFANPASPLAANIPMTPRLVADFAATFLYLDIHTGAGSEDAASPQIRGQIGTPPAGASTGTILVRKLTYPGGGTGFGFTHDIAAPNAFTLDDGQTQTFNAVPTGTYTVTETNPSPHSLSDVKCDDAASGGNSFTRTATIHLEPGEVVTCTFRNVLVAPADSIFVFHLNGAQEVPPTGSTAQGGCFAQFNSGASRLSIVCTHNVVGPTQMHFHRGAPGVNGPVLFDLGSPVSPVIATWNAMSPADVADLFGGTLYINIHTAGRPAGDIRGQVLPRTVDLVSFPLNSAQAVPPGTSPATGNCSADLDAPATALAISCTHNLPSSDLAHVHEGAAGTNGPEVFTFPNAATPNANVPMSPRLVADFAGGLLYLDIHSNGGSEETTDEIRGQIGAPPAAVTTGTIRIVKATLPAGGSGFGFTDNIPATSGSFTLNDAGAQTFANVTPGTYTVTENDPTAGGYTLTGIVCDDADSTTNPFSRAATVRLQAGELVTCTFRNLQTIASAQIFVFNLSGAQEVPPEPTTARGGCMAQLEAAAARMSIICTHNVVDATIMHIHRGAPGVNGPIVFDLGTPTSPVQATWTGMTPAEIADVLAGNLYVNIHASGRPAGEIR
ncbi:MAG TPA: CHRD domain-containing protein, partial [Thermoanaerobaculia bacterium]|nr:CHRD domain-containing protein [Thermoanaerobaculia bacterium]